MKTLKRIITAGIILILIISAIGAAAGTPKHASSTAPVAAAPTAVQQVMQDVHTKIKLDQATYKVQHSKQYLDQKSMQRPGATPRNQTECMYAYGRDMNNHTVAVGHFDSHLPALCNQAGTTR